jgi:gliding motility-associated-like protein
VSVSNNCGIATETINITTSTLPVLIITPSSVLICPNETATLTVSGGSEPYSWSNSSSTGSVVVTNGGTVTVSNTNACGTSSAITVVNVTNLNADFTANPVSGTLPVVVSFTNNSTGANSFAWNFGNGNSASSQNVSAETYSAVGVYTVYLTAFNGSCSDTYSLIINVFNEETTLVVPNVFTPNGDGSNDVYRISGKNITEFNCTIYDRWGLQMYYWDDIRNGWDGTNGNKMVPDGTYFYIIHAKDLDNKEIKRQGFLQLFQ